MGKKIVMISLFAYFFVNFGGLLNRNKRTVPTPAAVHAARHNALTPRQRQHQRKLQADIWKYQNVTNPRHLASPSLSR